MPLRLRRPTPPPLPSRRLKKQPRRLLPHLPQRFPKRTPLILKWLRKSQRVTRSHPPMPLPPAKQTQRPLKQAPPNLPLMPYRREKTTPNGWNIRRPLLLSGSMALRSNLATTLLATLPTRLTKKKLTES